MVLGVLSRRKCGAYPPHFEFDTRWLMPKIQILWWRESFTKHWASKKAEITSNKKSTGRKSTLTRRGAGRGGSCEQVVWQCGGGGAAVLVLTGENEFRLGKFNYEFAKVQ